MEEILNRREFLRKSGQVAAGFGATVLTRRFSLSLVEAASHLESSEKFFPETGFYVRDSQEGSFLSFFEKLGGIGTFGYPISRPYQLEGKFYQAFQRGVLSSKPESKEISLAPVMNWFSKEGKDGWLERFGIPPALKGGYSREERLSWLKEEKIKEVYFRHPSLYGLPASEPRPSGVFTVQRFENYVFQFWQKEVPEMPKKGSVVGVLVGEYAKQAGLIPQEALVGEKPKEEGKEAIYKGDAIYRGPHVPRVAITVDDGWWPNQIERAVEIAQRQQVKLDFFIVGRLLGQKDWQKPIEKSLAAGCELQNHTFNHLNLLKLREDCSSLGEWETKTAWEIKAAQEAILKWTSGRGNSGRYFRPPGGSYNGQVVNIAKSLGLEVVIWSGESQGDRTNREGKLPDSKYCLANLEATTSFGSISLMHTNWNDIGALDSYLSWLKEKGMSPVLLSELVPPRDFPR